MEEAKPVKGCLDVLNDLAEKISASAIPYQQKEIIVEQINVLWQLVFPWGV